jgi:3-oxoacyl-[acyl-carrier protein] reductase
MTMDIAVITGATGGLGRAMTRRLSDDGFAVVVHYASNRTGADELVATLGNAGGTAWSIQADLATDDGIDSLVEGVERIVGQDSCRRLGALVNNASCMLSPPFGQTNGSDFDAYFALNVRAPLILTQRLSSLMPSGSSVVNVSSAAAHFASPNDIAYAMSKAALEAMTVHAAPALAGRGIRVNSVIPGFTDNGHPVFKDHAILDHMSSFAAMGGVATPGVVADAVGFLVSEHASRTTGVSLDVSGGSTIGARSNGAGGISLRAVRETI